MTGRFETLIYTNCAEGEGLQGSAGLQFQASSSEAALGATEVVRRNLLYEPGERWMRERRPVHEYPPSFAHVRDGYLATAAGVYLGREPGGHREGNHLTHSVVTRSAESYGHVRPVQLFGAPFWTTRAAPTTRCPPIEGGWRPGPLDPPAVQRFVAGAPDSQRLLTSLLAAVQRIVTGHGRRVVFVARDATEVLFWLAAASLLIPQRAALSVGFKVFTTRPGSAQQQVLAVHPDTVEKPVSVEDDSGYHVFDLIRGVWSPVEPTATAALWARLFHLEDPYDVLDAVEVAAATELPAEQAATVALAAVLREAPSPSGTRTLAAWLRQGSPVLVKLYGRTVAERVLAVPDDLPAETLVDLDAALRAGRLADQAGSVRLALARAELRRAQRPGPPTEATLPPLPDDPDPENQARVARMVIEALRTATGPAFDGVLRVARRFGVEVPYAHLPAEVDAFLVDWLAHPERPYRSASWPGGEYLEERLRDRLAERARFGGEGADRIGDAWWPRLRLRPPPPRDALEAALLAANVLRGDPAHRKRVVDSWLGAMLELSTVDRREVGRGVSALWRRTPPNVDELRLLAQRLPRGTALEPYVFAALVAALEHGTASEPEVELCHELADRGVLRLDPRLSAALGEDRDLRLTCARIPHYSGPAGDLERTLRSVSPQTVENLRDLLVPALLESHRPAVVRAVLRAQPTIAEPYVAALAVTFAQAGEPVHTAVVLYLLGAHDLAVPVLDALTDERRTHLTRRLEQWTQRASQRKLLEVHRSLQELGHPWPQQWQRLIDQQSAHASWWKAMRRFM